MEIKSKEFKIHVIKNFIIFLDIFVVRTTVVKILFKKILKSEKNSNRT